MKVDVAIIGGGLSGLASAHLLHEAGKRVCVLEAADKLGGRIKSVFNSDGKFVADLGPTWVWPMFQPTIARWINRLGLETFPQFEAGQAVVDLGPGKPTQSGLIPTQDGNERLVGGSQALIDALASNLPDELFKLGTKVTSIEASGSLISIHTENDQWPMIEADQVIMALPPRVAINTIDWQQGLSAELKQAMSATPTWMAPHAKAAITYEKAFWRDAGLSGRIVSRIGPIVESHDHCGPDFESNGSTASLWGFIGWPRKRRIESGDNLEAEILSQLTRCFGEAAREPISINIEDWAANLFIASAADLSSQIQHPTVGPEVLRNPQMKGRLLFGASETAERSPGLIEGAFVSAERVASHLLA